jgi:hypothetical protein
MDVAEPLDVGDDLVDAGPPLSGAGGFKAVADQNDAGLAMARTDIGVGRPDP